MSYIALVIDRFDEVLRFYRDDLGFPIVDSWDRQNARGLRFDVGGMRLEIIDNQRERKPIPLGLPQGRVHLVIEVTDIDQRWRDLKINSPQPEATTWGARLFRIFDPDDIPITFIQWDSIQ